MHPSRPAMLEELPSELLVRIFDHIDAEHLWGGMRTMSQRMHSLVANRDYWTTRGMAYSNLYIPRRIFDVEALWTRQGNSKNSELEKAYADKKDGNDAEYPRNTHDMVTLAEAYRQCAGAERAVYNWKALVASASAPKNQKSIPPNLPPAQSQASTSSQEPPHQQIPNATNAVEGALPIQLLNSSAMHSGRQASNTHYGTIDAVHVLGGGGGRRLCLTGARDRTLLVWDLEKVWSSATPPLAPTTTASSIGDGVPAHSSGPMGGGGGSGGGEVEASWIVARKENAHRGWIWSLCTMPKTQETGVPDSVEFWSGGWDNSLRQWHLTGDGRIVEAAAIAQNFSSSSHFDMGSAVLSVLNDGSPHLVYVSTYKAGPGVVDTRAPPSRTQPQSIVNVHRGKSVHGMATDAHTPYIYSIGEDDKLVVVDKRMLRGEGGGSSGGRSRSSSPSTSKCWGISSSSSSSSGSSSSSKKVGVVAEWKPPTKRGDKSRLSRVACHRHYLAVSRRSGWLGFMNPATLEVENEISLRADCECSLDYSGQASVWLAEGLTFASYCDKLHVYSTGLRPQLLSEVAIGDAPASTMHYAGGDLVASMGTGSLSFWREQAPARNCYHEGGAADSSLKTK